jgi:arylsulfatase A-like enzyme
VIYYREYGIREGDWKAIRGKKGNKPELYNLKDDLSEKNNLAAEHPDKVKELMARHKAWYDALKAEMRPHARMADLRPLVTVEEAKHLPTLRKWLDE